MMLSSTLKYSFSPYLNFLSISSRSFGGEYVRQQRQLELFGELHAGSSFVASDLLFQPVCRGGNFIQRLAWALPAEEVD